MIEAAFAAGIVALACVVWGPRGVRALHRRALRRARGDPRADPFATRIDPECEGRLEIVLNGAEVDAVAEAEAWDRLHRGDPIAAAAGFRAAPSGRAEAGLAAAALAVCGVAAPGWHWRGGLQRAVPTMDRALQAAPADDEVRAVAAQLWAGLGHLDRARALVQGLPADHWRACLARFALYDHAGDRRRADAALQAAAWLAPAPVADRLAQDLAAFRGGRAGPGGALYRPLG